ncbi:hypothetical protein ACX3O0_15645 [Homoserinimonas sp. A447]
MPRGPGPYFWGMRRHPRGAPAANKLQQPLSLFLLGIAALVRGVRSQLVLTVVATTIFILSVVLTTMIPFMAL